MATGFCTRRSYAIGLCTGIERGDPGYAAARDGLAGGGRRATVHGTGVRRTVGAAAVASAAGSAPARRCGGRLETRPPLALAQGSPPYYGADRTGRGGLSQPHGGH